MLFNPTKCYKMSVYQSRSPVVKDYSLYNQTLAAVQQHPYLGVLLSSDLRWNSHVDKIAKKGNSILAFVKRKCSEETKQAAYVSLVRPHLEYATAVWDPYRQNQVEKLEAVQSRDYNTSVSKLKKSLSLGLLNERQKSHHLLMPSVTSTHRRHQCQPSSCRLLRLYITTAEDLWFWFAGH